ncbi:D-hexose-6-phosphate mutarotase [Lysobacter fragariae]
MAHLQLGDDAATVCPHGAQVLSWRCAGRDRLYLSPRATFAAGQAIRGGVPVIFPQFAAHGPGLRHGFARLREWERQPGHDTGHVRFLLREDPDSLRAWPHPFEAALTVTLQDRRLRMALRITNTGNTGFTFTAALHTYLRTAANPSLRGLEGRTYADSTAGGATARQDEAPLRFTREIDRIYPDVFSPDVHPLLLEDDANLPLRIEQRGFRDVVVWNPGADLAARLADLGAGEHANFVCVEAACVAHPLQLPAGASWEGSQVLTALDTATRGALLG